MARNNRALQEESVPFDEDAEKYVIGGILQACQEILCLHEPKRTLTASEWRERYETLKGGKTREKADTTDGRELARTSEEHLNRVSDFVQGVVENLGETSQNFYRIPHKLTYAAVVRLWKARVPIDLFTVTRDLKTRGELERVGGVRYLYELQECVPGTANVWVYAEAVREEGKRRRLIDAGNEIASKASREEVPASETLESGKQLLTSIETQGAGVDTTVWVEAGMATLLSEMEEIQTRKREFLGLSTGFHDLDKTLNGLQGGQLLLVAARPSMGKSAFAQNIMAHVASRERLPVLLFSLEMTATQVYARMIAAETRIDSQSVINGALSPASWARVCEAAGTLGSLSIGIDRSDSIAKIMAVSRNALREHPNLGVVVVDYLQLITGKATGDFQYREREVAENTRLLKNLALELNVPVIGLSQLNRETEKRGDKRPLLADLRESGELEQAADVVMFLYREDYYNEGATPPGNPSETEILIRKNRNGGLGTVMLDFYRPWLLFQTPNDAF